MKQVRILFDLNKKSYVVAYLYFILFAIGAHRFYTRNYKTAFMILALNIAYFISYFVSTEVFSLLTCVILTIVFADLFLTYKNVKIYNTALAAKYGL